MTKIRPKRYNFYFEFFEKGSLPFFYSRSSEFKNINRIPDLDSLNQKFTSNLFIVNCIPPYLKHLTDRKKEFGCYSKSYRPGFLMDLVGFNNTAQYLKKQLKPKPYKNLRQDINRLCRDYNISFKIYYGEIEREYFQILIDKLEYFIRRRFNQKNKYHSALSRWAYYSESLYQMILSKKASFFVLYDGKKPIGISVNYHYDNILDAAISSYDIDYHKYSIGKHLFVKQIEWCFKNDYALIDLRWGDFRYKRHFANKVVKYKTHVIFNKKSLLKRVMSFAISHVLYFNYLVKEKKLKN
ncbi:GNAT family N-acetyltransferase [Flagellimonas sp. 2504JD1-5]